MEKSLELILGNSNKRFSGVTSTMLQVLPYQQEQAEVYVLGKHHVSSNVTVISFGKAIRLFRRQPVNGKSRVFHARRNDEMIQALILQNLFGCKFKIVFTSTAQRKKSWLTRWLMNQMDGLVTTCSAAAKYMDTPADVVVPHGVETKTIQNAAPMETLDLPFKYSVGIFGRVREQKGVDLLVDALISILPEKEDWGAFIVGEITPEQASFKNKLTQALDVAGLGHRVLFTDKVKFEQLPRYFQTVDIVCALSINEGFGLTVLEGLAAGKPVVATKAGAWPDIVSSDVGRLIEVGDKNALCSALKELMKSDSLRREMGHAGKLLVDKQYTVSREAGQLISFFKSL